MYAQLYGSGGMLVLMRREIAENLVDRIIDVADRLNTSVLEINGLLGQTASEAYKQGVGHVIGYMFADVLRPIFREHPDLEPENFKTGTPLSSDGRLNRYTAKRLSELVKEIESVTDLVESESAPGGESELWREGADELRNGTKSIREFLNDHALP